MNTDKRKIKRYLSTSKKYIDRVLFDVYTQPKETKTNLEKAIVNLMDVYLLIYKK